MPLSALACKTLGPGRHPDGAGLYLQVRVSPRTGRRRASWLYRYQRAGRAHDLGLGPWPEVSLGQAREKAFAQRQLLKAAGVDPLQARAAEAATARASAVSARTFQECAREYIAAHEGEWSNAKHGWQWARTLEKYAYPIIGDVPVQDVDTAAVLRVLTPIWDSYTVTASRLRSRLEEIIGYAMHRGYRPQGDNPARWEHHLKFSLARPGKIAPVQPQPALPFDQLPAFYAALRTREGVPARALAWCILTACRTGDVTGQPRDHRKPGARWDQIDLKARVWEIPSTKTGASHRVPLSDEAVALLGALPRVGPCVFPGTLRGEGALGEHGLRHPALAKALRNVPGGPWCDQHGAPITAHGFRATFSTWVAECTQYPPDLREAALAHAVKGVAGDYQRGDLLERRRALMEAWADYCSKPVPTAATVRSIGRRTRHA
jgi:integrase